MDWLAALVSLTAMEIVLGIDNIVFITILAGRLPVHQQVKARVLGLGIALGMRVLLLFSISWVMRATDPVFHLTDLGIPAAWVDGEPGLTADSVAAEHAAPAEAEEAPSGHGHAVPGEHDINGISWRDLILLAGGLFLIGKSVLEIDHKLEGHGPERATSQKASFNSVLAQIVVLDMVFSLDSVITAVGMAKQLWVMIVAVVISIGVMLAAAGSISRFVEKHPTLKILALSFLILIGVLLTAEGIGTPVNKGYIYFAMAFSLVVEMLNIKLRKHPHSAPVPGIE